MLVESSRDEALELAEGEDHHLRVRRAEDGDRVELRDGAGLTGRGRVVRRGRGWGVTVEHTVRIPAPAPLILGVGAGDKERFEWLIEKATELGVTALVPLETERALAVATRVRTAQIEKLRRRALEAVKQCGAAWAPAVAPPEPIAVFLARPAAGARWLADAEGQPAGGEGAGELTIVVGPEGGLTPGERAATLAAGYRPVRLAENVLRFETAAIAAATLAATARANARGGLHG